MGIFQGDRAAPGKIDYRFFFVPYSKHIKPLCGIVIGDDEVEQYLLKAGLQEYVAKEWLKQLRTSNFVMIDNAFLPDEFLGAQRRRLHRQEQARRRIRRNPLSAFLHSLRFVSKAEVEANH